MNVPVWLIASTFEPRSSSLYTLRLAGRLPDYGFDPLIVCASAKQVPPRLRTALQFREVPFLQNRIWRHFNLRRFVDELSAQWPAFLHAQRRGNAVATAALSREMNRPYLATTHRTLASGETADIPTTNLARIIAVTRVIERELVDRLGLGQDLVQVIHNGVEMPAESDAKRPPHSIPVVGMASVLEPNRGGLYFLMAAELILASGQDVEFVIAGVGPDEPLLRRAVNKLEIGHRVTFVGHAFDYQELLSAIDVFVAPSMIDGPSTMLLEAMAFGVPVVAVDAGGMSESFEHQKQLLLCDSDNHLALADQIQYLLDNPIRARRLAETGMTYVRDRFSVERMVSETAALYREIVSGEQRDQETRVC